MSDFPAGHPIYREFPANHPIHFYPRVFTTAQVDPAWLLGYVRPVQEALWTYESWAADHGWASPVTSCELIGRVFCAAFNLEHWLDLLCLGEAKATTKDIWLCSILAILREACAAVLGEAKNVRWADDELRVVALKPRAKPIQFKASALDGFTLAVETLEACAAPQAVLPTDAESAPATPNGGCIISLGNNQYQIGDDPAVALTDTEDRVLQSYLGDGDRRPPRSAMDHKTLFNLSNVEHAPKVLNRLRKKYDGRFAGAIVPPGGKGDGGYCVSIKRADAADGLVQNCPDLS